MRAFKVSKNGKYIVTVSPDELDTLDVSILVEKHGAVPTLRIQGVKSDDKALHQHLWVDSSLLLGDQITIHFLEVENSDRPPHELHTPKSSPGPYCLFCGKSAPEVGDVFLLPFSRDSKRAGICRACVSSFAASGK